MGIPAARSDALAKLILDDATPRRSARLMFTWKALIALVVTWCLLAVAAILAASTKRLERWYMYFVAASVLVGVLTALAITLLP